MYKMILLIIPLLSYFGFLDAMAPSDEYHFLDEIAIKSGADKSSRYHNYTEIYSKYFAPIKDLPIKFLEIGVLEGSSARMWEEYFKSAELHFIDINFSKTKHFSLRCHYHLCNQESSFDLEHFVKLVGGDFDIILDDGGHTMLQQINSFCTLFPHLKSKGLYIIEDLHTSYWSQFGGGGANSTIEFLKKLIDEVNYVGMRTAKASHLHIPAEIQKELNLYREQIESIHFYDSVAIIFKR